MKKSARAEKKRILWDGYEVPGLIEVQELKLTKATIKIPSFKKLRIISSNIVEIPAIQLKYLCHKGTDTYKFWKDFFMNESVMDATEIRVDQYDEETERRIWVQCECFEMQTAKYSAEQPEAQSITVQVAAWDINFL